MPEDLAFDMPPEVGPRWEKFGAACARLLARTGRAGNYFESDAPLREIAEICGDLAETPPSTGTLPVFLRGLERLHDLRDRFPPPEPHDPLDGEAPPANLYLSDLNEVAADLGAVVIAFEERDRNAARPATNVAPVSRAAEARVLNPISKRIEKAIGTIAKVRGALANVNVASGNKIDVKINIALDGIKLDLTALLRELGNRLVDVNWSGFFQTKLAGAVRALHDLLGGAEEVTESNRRIALAFFDETQRLLTLLRAWLGKYLPERDLGPAPPKTDSLPLAPGTVFRDIDAPWCPEMVVIQAGRFWMGSPENENGRRESEGPRREVIIEAPFALGRYPVTFAEYDRFAEATRRPKPDDAGWGRGRRPVINVSWGDARSYLDWLSAETGQPYRLPSEAEWEYACRAGTTTPFHTGATISTDRANYDGSRLYSYGKRGKYRQRTTEVGQFPANDFGLYDMHGNVWEWCADDWHEYYRGAPTDGRAWTAKEGKEKILRGGSWGYSAGFLRSAVRDGYLPDVRVNVVGFRAARTLAR